MATAIMDGFKSLTGGGGVHSPFLRLTMLGARGCGKTCLVNSWVNNFCPTMYQPTREPTNYYRTVRLQVPDHDDEIATVMVEIEDTCEVAAEGAGSISGRVVDITKGTPRVNRTDGSFDVEKLRRFIEVNPQQHSGETFSGFPAPSRKHHAPLSKCRMGFIVVFDASDPKTFEDAKEIIGMIHTAYATNAMHHQRVYLVANKIDKDPYSNTRQRCLTAAREYADENDRRGLAPLRFQEVSALDYTCVRKFFRDALEDLCASGHFVSLEAGANVDGAGTTGDNKDCSLQ